MTLLLVHVSPRALAVLEGRDPSRLVSAICPCGESTACLDNEQWISASEAIGREEDPSCAHPTPTCFRCQLAWDAAVERGGGKP